ncbi:MAG: hypothetical protein RIC35_13015 [Marinoscillum sp.]
MKTKEPYVSIHHHETNKDITHFDIIFRIHKSQDVYGVLLQKASLNGFSHPDLPPDITEDDQVFLYSFDEKMINKWEKLRKSKFGWINSNRVALKEGNFDHKSKGRLYVASKDDSTPEDKYHEGTFHWPKP